MGIHNRCGGKPGRRFEFFPRYNFETILIAPEQHEDPRNRTENRVSIRIKYAELIVGVVKGDRIVPHQFHRHFLHRKFFQDRKKLRVPGPIECIRHLGIIWWRHQDRDTVYGFVSIVASKNVEIKEEKGGDCY